MAEGVPSPLLPGRLVTFKNGDAKYAVACGEQLQWVDGQLNVVVDADGNPLRYVAWPGKLVGYKNGIPRYAVASECCEYPVQDDVTGSAITDMSWVEKDNWPPYGISKHLRVYVGSTLYCPKLDCTHALLTYNGSGHWLGSVGGFPVDAYLQQFTDVSDPPGVVRTRLLFDAGTGCLPVKTVGSATSTVNIHTDPAAGPVSFLGMGDGSTSVFPFRAAHTGFLGAATCCGCTNARIHLVFFGFCQRRRVGRLVGFKNGVPRYAVGGCCVPCRQADNCCNLYNGCALSVTASVGLQKYLNGSPSTFCSWANEIPFPLQTVPTVPPWTWDSGPLSGATVNNCGTWQIYMKCDPLTVTCNSGTAWKLAECRFTFRIENHDSGCGCVSEQIVDVCNCEPLELSFRGECHTAPVPPPVQAGCDVTFSATVHLP